MLFPCFIAYDIKLWNILVAFLSKCLFLAVIAYKSPILQSDVIKIRTNKAYDHLKLLEDQSFITREKHGRTKLIKITQKFYDYFEISPEELQKKFEEKKVKELALSQDELDGMDIYGEMKEQKKLELYDEGIPKDETGLKYEGKEDVDEGKEDTEDKEDIFDDTEDKEDLEDTEDLFEDNDDTGKEDIDETKEDTEDTEDTDETKEDTEDTDGTNDQDLEDDFTKKPREKIKEPEFDVEYYEGGFEKKDISKEELEKIKKQSEEIKGKDEKKRSNSKP
ncbi:SMC-Scp complex subunit ScpB [Nanoarchaeota archaeon]